MLPYASGIMVFGGIRADGNSCHDCWLLTLGPHAALDLREGESFWKEIHVDGNLPSGNSIIPNCCPSLLFAPACPAVLQIVQRCTPKLCVFFYQRVPLSLEVLIRLV